jgi:dienelactone hydrolase
MKLFVRLLLLLAVMYPAHSYSEEFLRQPNGRLATMMTPDGVSFGLWGTRVAYPAPTLLVFSATIEESLEDPYFRQSGTLLADQGFICISLDLPGHGRDERGDEPTNLAAWRYRSDKSEDFVTPFTQQVTSVLDYLVEQGYTDPERIAACGTSRGGFMALHATAADERIRATAAFAPVTALMTLREFEGTENQPFADSLSIKAHADRLAGRSLWLVIGDRDERVGTDDTIAFARRVSRLSLEQSKLSDVTLLVQPEPKGHTTPEASPERAALWIVQRLINPPLVKGEE